MLTKIPGANYHMLVIYQDLTYLKKKKNGMDIYKLYAKFIDKSIYFYGIYCSILPCLE